MENRILKNLKIKSIIQKKLIQHTVSFLMAIAFLFLFYSSSGSNTLLEVNAKSKAAGHYTIQIPSGGIYADSTGYTLRLKNASSGVKWSVSDTSIASIKKKSGSKALLKPKKKGIVTVTAVFGNRTLKKKINIKAPRLTSSSMVFYPGKKYKLQLKSASSGIRWSISPKSTATLKKGSRNKAVLTTKKSGTVTVTAKYKNISYKKQIPITALGLSSSQLIFNNTQAKPLKLKGVLSSSAYAVTDWASLSSTATTHSKIYWAIENPLLISIAKSAAGKITVTPRAKGTTRIAAKYNGTVFYTKVVVNAAFKTEKDTLSEADLTLPDQSLPTNIPAYWKDELGKTIALSRKREQLEGNMSKFIFLTDPHWSSNAGHSPAICNYLTTVLHPEMTVIGGDVISGVYTKNEGGQTPVQNAFKEIESFYSGFTSDVKLLTAVGNHDTNSNSKQNETNGLKLSNSDLYLKMIKRSENFAHITTNSLDSYVDDKTNKVRYISFFYDGIHSEETTSARIQWLDKRVSELKADWTVIIFSHAYWAGAIAGTNNRPAKTSAALGRHIANLDAASKADIALWMVGHCHRDLNAKIASDDGKADLNVVSTNCDSLAKSSYWGGLSMKRDTISEQVLDLVQINTRKHQIYLTRIGGGKNRFLTY